MMLACDVGKYRAPVWAQVGHMNSSEGEHAMHEEWTGPSLSWNNDTPNVFNFRATYQAHSRRSCGSPVLNELAKLQRESIGRN